jgi:nucleoside 2-deoxyribosyltransferase
MPFVERDSSHPAGYFQEVLSSLIIPAAEANDFSVSTANRGGGSDVIQSTIVNELLQADLVIADLTEHNPNVLFELGMRMAEDKPVALIRSEGTGRIFDVDNMLRVYDYSPCLWPSTVEADVPEMAKHFSAAWENRDTDISYMKLLRQHARTGQPVFQSESR